MTDRPFTSDSFYQFAAEKKLMGSRCQTCGTLYCPPKPICIKCHSDKMEWVELKGKGKIAAFSVIPYGPMPFVKEGYGRGNPHCSGIVELEEGPRIAAQIIGVDMAHPEQIKIGTKVTLDFAERGSWHFVEDVAKVKKTYPVFKVQ
jgi:uncharacterized OB-fold protein